MEAEQQMFDEACATYQVHVLWCAAITRKLTLLPVAPARPVLWPVLHRRQRRRRCRRFMSAGRPCGRPYSRHPHHQVRLLLACVIR